MVANTSATGGYLTPSAEPVLEGQALNRFIQQLVAGITGLDGKLVRPAWQSEPPNIPDGAVAWAGVRVTTSPGDTFPYVKHDADGDGSDEVQRNIQLNVLTSFYDLGTNGLADHYVGRLRDGLAVPQNREVLTRNNMGLTSVGAPIAAPVLLKERWLVRIDFPFILGQQVNRTYSVLNLLSASGQIVLSDGEVLDFTSEQGAPP